MPNSETQRLQPGTRVKVTHTHGVHYGDIADEAQEPGDTRYPVTFGGLVIYYPESQVEQARRPAWTYYASQEKFAGRA